MFARVFCRDCLSPRSFDISGGDRSATCPGCSKPISLDLPATDAARAPLEKCPACGSGGLYLESDFPRLLGWGILLATLALFLYAVVHWPRWSTFVLLGVAGLDYLVYRSLPLRTVCYRCCAEYRGFPANPGLRGFDLETAQKFPEYESFLKTRRAQRGGGDR